MNGPMSVMPVVNASPLRYSEHTLDATCNPANNAADYTANGASNRTCYIIALMNSFLCATNDPLSLCCYRHGKNGERQ